jgi:anti-anti-sigma regulatory factor
MDAFGSLTWRLRRDGIAVVEIAGKVERRLAKQLAADLLDLVRSGTTAVGIDLSEVDGSDFSLFTAFARAHAALRARSGHLYLIVGDDRMLDQLHRSGFDRIATVVFGRAYREQIARRSGERLTVRLTRRSSVIDLRDAVQHRRRGATVTVARA